MGQQMSLMVKETWIYRFWYSPKQDETAKRVDGPGWCENYVTIDGVRQRYSECASIETHPDYKSGWPDAVLLGEAHIKAVEVGRPHESKRTL